MAAFLAAGSVAARYVAVLVGRSPICAFVPASSAIERPDQLSGRRVGGAVWAMAEFVGAMSWLGLAPALVVPTSRTSGGGLLQEACAMLVGERVDMVADFEDLLPRARRHSGMDLRSVPLGAEVYSSGLVAGDEVPDELVGRVCAAVRAALERQRRDPALEMPELRWQSSARQMAARVENRTALARPFFRIGRFTTVMSTSSALMSLGETVFGRSPVTRSESTFVGTATSSLLEPKSAMAPTSTNAPNAIVTMSNNVDSR